MSKVFNMVGGGGGPAASIFVTGLSETDTVTATKGSKTLTGKWLQKPNPDYIGLPDGYTQLEYIESSGTQYIDTGYVFKQTTGSIKTKTKALQFGSGYAEYRLGGAYNGNRSYILYGAYNTFYCGLGEKDVDTGIVNTVNQVNEIEVSISTPNTCTFTVNDTKTTFSYTGTVAGTSTYYIFGTHEVGSPSYLGKYDVYYFKMHDGTTLVRDYIPCKRNSDGVVGLYDKIEQKFYTNAGTGEFIAGPEVPQIIGGFLIKPIRDLGTWTVTATDGVDTLTQDVLVDVITEYEIEMLFGKLWLYRDGDECEDVTGGWSIGVHTYGDGLATVTKNDSNVYMHTPSASEDECPLTTIGKIDLTNYSKLCATLTGITGYPNNDSPLLHLSANPSVRGFDGTNALHSRISWNGNSTQELSMDISAISDKRYITVGITGRDSYPITSAYVTRVWFEK